MRLPTFAEHRRFCEVDGWDLHRPVRKHYVYTRLLRSGELLRTTVSKGDGHYGDPGFWASIRNRQLRVSEEQFWDAVEGGLVPDRGDRAGPAPAGEPIPYTIASTLLKDAGYSHAELEGMTKDAAVAAYTHWLTYKERPPG